MAYRRSSTRRRSYAGRSTTARRSGYSRRAAPRARTARRSGRVTAQTLRIVVEQIPANAVTRPAGPFVASAPAKPKKAKY